MRVSKKAEYALRAVVAISRRGAARPVQIQDLSEAEHIPVKFLEQILLVLKKGGLLQSKRGAGGGYLLEQKPEEISVGHVLDLIDGPFIPASCNDPGKPGLCGCGRPLPCGLGRSFTRLQSTVESLLRSTSIAQVLQDENPVLDSFDI